MKNNLSYSDKVNNLIYSSSFFEDTNLSKSNSIIYNNNNLDLVMKYNLNTNLTKMNSNKKDPYTIELFYYSDNEDKNVYLSIYGFKCDVEYKEKEQQYYNTTSHNNKNIYKKIFDLKIDEAKQITKLKKYWKPENLIKLCLDINFNNKDKKSSNTEIFTLDNKKLNDPNNEEAFFSPTSRESKKWIYQSGKNFFGYNQPSISNTNTRYLKKNITNIKTMKLNLKNTIFGFKKSVLKYIGSQNKLEKEIEKENKTVSFNSKSNTKNSKSSNKDSPKGSRIGINAKYIKKKFSGFNNSKNKNLSNENYKITSNSEKKSKLNVILSKPLLCWLNENEIDKSEKILNELESKKLLGLPLDKWYQYIVKLYEKNKKEQIFDRGLKVHYSYIENKEEMDKARMRNINKIKTSKINFITFSKGLDKLE